MPQRTMEDRFGQALNLNDNVIADLGHCVLECEVLKREFRDGYVIVKPIGEKAYYGRYRITPNKVVKVTY